MTVIFDLDYTLIDTASFKDDIASVLGECGVAEGAFAASYAEVSEKGPRIRDFDLRRQLRALEDDMTCGVAEAERKVMAVMQGLTQRIVPGAAELLDDLRKDGHQLILLTHGNPAWQELKIRSAGLEGRFDRIVIVEGAKEELPSSFGDMKGPVAAVNDNPDEIVAMRKRWPAFRMIGIEGPKGPITAEGVPVCRTMKEVRTILNTL